MPCEMRGCMRVGTGIGIAAVTATLAGIILRSLQ